MAGTARSTIWCRLPAACGRPGIYRTVAAIGALLLAAPALVALVFRRAAAAWLAPLALRTWADDPLGAQIIAGLEPARRAQLPMRIETAVRALLPRLGLLGLVVAVGFALAAVAFGRFFRRAFEAAGPAESVPSARVRLTLMDALVFLAGLGAHLHYIRESFNTDEAASMIHALSRWWAPLDTRFGWQIHIGGELLARIGFGALGVHDWAARVPSAICSSLGLVFVARWLGRRHGAPVAILTVGFLCALPLWAEQATLARGYGLLFLAGALAIPALWDVLDGTAADESRALGMLFAASLLGFLAHFFFLFFALAAIGLLMRCSWRHSRALPAAGVAWMLLGLLPAGVLYLPGLPATLYQSRTTGRLAPGAVLHRFVEALGFELGGVRERIACGVVLGLLAIGLVMLKKGERTRVLLLLAVSVGVPALMRPVYFYPRFFIHLLPLLFPLTLPVAALLPAGRMRSLAAAGFALALWALPRPWARLPLTDLRGASDALRARLRPGETAYADRFYVQTRFYLGGVPVEYVPLDRGVPKAARLVLLGYDMHDPEPRPPGLHVVQRFPGCDHEMLLYEAN